MDSRINRETPKDKPELKPDTPYRVVASNGMFEFEKDDLFVLIPRSQRPGSVILNLTKLMIYDRDSLSNAAVWYEQDRLVKSAEIFFGNFAT